MHYILKGGFWMANKMFYLFFQEIYLSTKITQMFAKVNLFKDKRRTFYSSFVLRLLVCFIHRLFVCLFVLFIGCLSVCLFLSFFLSSFFAVHSIYFLLLIGTKDWSYFTITFILIEKDRSWVKLFFLSNES